MADPDPTTDLDPTVAAGPLNLPAMAQQYKRLAGINTGLSGMTQPQPAQPGFGQPAPQQRPPPTRTADTPIPQPPPQQQQGWRTPYRRATNRGYGAWGTDDWNVQGLDNYENGGDMPPGLPSSREAISLIMGAGGLLGRWGPPGVAQPAMAASGLAAQLRQYAPLLDLVSKGQFSQNMLKAQQAKFSLAESQMALEGEKAVTEMNKLLTEWSRIYKTWELGGIDDSEARNRATELAIASGHKEILAVLQHGDLNAVESYIEDMDKLTRDLNAGVSATRKGSKSGAVEPYADTAESGGSGIPKRQEERFKTAQAPDVTTGTPAAPPVQITTDAEADAYIDKKYSRAAADARAQRAGGVNQGGLQAAHDWLMDSDAIKTKFGTAGNAIKAGEDLRAQIFEAARDPNLTSMRDKFAAISAIDPALGSVAKSVHDFRSEINHIPAASGREHIRRIITQIDPNFDFGNYGNVHKFYDVRQPEAQVIAKTTETVSGISNLLGAINDTLGKDGKDNQSIPRRVWERWIKGVKSGDPEYDELYNAINAIAQQYSGIINLSGAPRVRTVQMIVEHMSPTSSPRSIAEQARNDLSNAWAVLNHYQGDWERLTGRKTLNPAIDEHTWKSYSALARMNWDTGTMPKDAPIELRALSRPIDKASSRIPEDKRKPPLESADLAYIQHYIRENENSQDPDVQARIRIMERRLPRWINVRTDVPEEERATQDASRPRR